MMVWVRPEPALPLRGAGPRLREAARGATRSRRTSRTIVAWLRLRAGEWDEAERVARGASCATERRVAQLAREDRAGRSGDTARRRRRRRAAGRSRGPGRSRGRAAAARARVSSSRRVGADDAARRCRSSGCGSSRRGAAERQARSFRGCARVAPGASPGWTSSAPAAADAARAMLRGDWRARGRRLRRRRLELRPRADALAARRRGVARGGDRDRPRRSARNR